MLVLLSALGAGPASLLPRGWPARARAGLAPVLGLCLAACGLTTLEWFAPASSVAVALPVACAVSLAVACRRGWPGKGLVPALRGLAARRLLLGAVQVLAVLAACLLPVATALAAHHSVGPMSYEVYDGPGYVANAEAASSLSIHAAASGHHVSGYVTKWWSLDAASSNRLDYAPVVAAVDSLLGLNATQTYAADLLAVLAAGGLGCFAAVLATAGRRQGIAATLAGAAFGGSFFLQLVFDGSQAAICGLAVLVPLALLLAAAARAPSAATLGLSALLLAGMATLYPILLFPVVLSSGAAAAAGIVRSRRRGRLRRPALLVWGARAAAVVAGAALLDVVATVRDAASLGSIATGGGVLSSFPKYHLGAGVVASWLLQTRDLYSVAFGPQSALHDALPALVVPVAVLAAAAPGLRRNPLAWLCLLLVAVPVALGAYESVRNGCSYCEDRSMLSAVPPLVFLVFSGLGTTFASARVLGRLAVGAVVVAYAGFAAYGAANARARYAAGSVYVTSAERALVARIPRGAGPVELEGFGAVPGAIAAEPYLYELLVARGLRVSVATTQEGAGIAEDWGPEPLRPPWFHPGYGYVLTRLSGVAMRRQLAASAGRMALERRVGHLDVTVEAGLGLATPSARLPTVTGPLWLVVSGAGPQPVAVRAGLEEAGSGQGSPGGRHVARCWQLAGRTSVRAVRLAMPRETGALLRSLTVATGDC